MPDVVAIIEAQQQADLIMLSRHCRWNLSTFDWCENTQHTLES